MPASTKPLTSVELFAGVGGLALGCELAGFNPLILAESVKWPCVTLRANHAGTVIEGDVRDIDWATTLDRPIDLVTGGPPCQPFSLGGLALAHTDPRDMFPATIEAVRDIAPRAFIIENVRGFLRPRFKDYYNFVVDGLTNPGPNVRYNVTSTLIDAADYGVPQHRWRVFLIGFRDDITTDWTFPEPTHAGNQLTVRDAIADMPEPGPVAPPGLSGHIYWPGARIYLPQHTGSPWDQPSRTIVAMGGAGSNMLRREDGTVRFFTVRECARLQTFPDTYEIAGPRTAGIRQLGNAVPVRLAQIIATSVREALERATDRQ